ncbi:hypothetical protein AB0F93_28370 [Micromonospora tulbaghiae]|uniref:hypothetical protein n=1 Tax=Micromonospora tulbaghiae TaxID=479978 RepID=UPI00332D3081
MWNPLRRRRNTSGPAGAHPAGTAAADDSASADSREQATARRRLLNQAGSQYERPAGHDAAGPRPGEPLRIRSCGDLR